MSVNYAEKHAAKIDEAFSIAPEGSGPLLLAARYNFSIHRLDVAESYLDRADRRAARARSAISTSRRRRVAEAQPGRGRSRRHYLDHGWKER